MAEDFQAGVCGGSWWMPPGTAFNRSSCSSVIADMQNFGPFWPRDLVDMKSNSSDSSSDWIQNFLLVQEGLNTFPTSCDDGLEAEDQGFTMDQQQSLDFYPSSLLQSLSNTSFPPSADDNISSFPPSVFSQFNIPVSYKERESCQKLSPKINDQKLWGKSSDELLFKRPRLETPSPLPTFKVRKEKLGDRITALQQLVSPFGKTDTASVLHEAIEYIKLLHDQINILSAPYMIKGATKQLQQIDDRLKEREEHEKDLTGLGLCLLPVSTMFPVANEMAAGFLTTSYKLDHLH